MKELKAETLSSVSGAGYGKDEAVNDAVVLTGVYYQLNSNKEPSLDEILETVEYLAEELRDRF